MKYLLEPLLVGLFLCCFALSACAEEGLPFQMQLPRGSKHETLGEKGKIAGKITRPDRPEILYDVGRRIAAGESPKSGDFVDAALAIPPESRHWLKEQTIGGRKLNAACGKDDVLAVSFPETGTNFRVKAKTPEEVANSLLTILSYQPDARTQLETALQRRTSLAAEQSSLAMLVESLQGKLKEFAPDAEIRIVGDHLKLEGITRNQMIRNFKAEDATLAGTLTALVIRANPGPVTGSTDKNLKLIWVVGPVPDQPSRLAILITTREAARREKYLLPQEFVTP